MISTISEITALWQRALAKIEKIIDESAVFDAFFSNSYINSIENNTIIIVGESTLAVNAMKTKYLDIIQDVINDLTEIRYNLEFIEASQAIKTSVIKTFKTNVNSADDDYFADAKINQNLTFDNFVVGQFNKEANQAAKMIAQKPGKMFNPLFLFSNSGLGKTHLLNAIGNYVTNVSKPGAKILYINANDFVEEYMKFVKGEKDSRSLKDFFRGVDVLLLDDVQFLANKVNTEEMFFHIYSSMINDGRQVVITSDRQPNELKGIEDRLVTRFTQGLQVKINEPDQPTCIEILKKKIADEGLDINKFDPSVLYLFAEKFSSNVRELEGALNRLFFIIGTDSPENVTIEIAIKAVQSLLGAKASINQLSEQKIINAVADYYNLIPTQLTGKLRTGQIALARHIAMYLMRSMLDVSLKRVGEMFGGKDHTTVMSAINKVEKELKTDEKLQQAIEELKKKLNH